MIVPNNAGFLFLHKIKFDMSLFFSQNPKLDSLGIDMCGPRESKLVWHCTLFSDYFGFILSE